MNKKEFDYQWVKDPEIFSINQLEPTSDHLYFLPGETDFNEMEQRYSLNGLWNFNYGKNISSVNNNFFEKDFDCKTWDTIKVPGHIQMQGYGNPHYVNTMYPWDGVEPIVPGEIPETLNSVGQYVKYFYVPKNWSEKVCIALEGVETAFAIWLNGNFVGYSEDSFNPAKFDLTEFVVSGENKLCISVFQYSSGSWLEDQDFWRFSGIFRDVYLYTEPTIHLSDFFVTTKINLENKTAQLNVKTLTTKDCTIKINLKDKDNNLIVSQNFETFDKKCLCALDVESPNLWSAENPYLYNIELLLYNNDILQEFVPYKIGFREFKLQKNIMTINGKRIKFKGVNRHDFSCHNGRATSKEEILQDILIMKQHNINALRMSHYPNQKYIYEICDEYGLYVIDETNLETHGTWLTGGTIGSEKKYILPDDKEEWAANVLYRGKSMFQRNKNHTSIIIWSCGNESYGGKTIYDLSNYFRSVDSTRLVHYEGVSFDSRFEDTSDMISRMYFKPNEIKNIIETNPDKPFINCEFSHAMGNSNGNFHKYMELFDEYEQYQGGFIWDFIDQSILTKDIFGNDYLAYGGDFNDRPTDTNFCVNGLIFGDKRISPKIIDIKYHYQDYIITPSKDFITIRNDNLFVDTQGLLLKTIVLENGKEIFRKVEEVVIASGTTEKIPVTFPEFESTKDYTIISSLVTKEAKIWCEAGFEVAFGQKLILSELDNDIVPKGEVKVINGGSNVGVKGNNFHIIFSKSNGHIVSYKYGNNELILNPPKPNFWRASTDNDRGCKSDYEKGVWKIASLYQKLTSFSFEDNKESTTINLEYSFNFLIEQPIISIKYKVYGDGTVSTELNYKGNNELPYMYDFGFVFELPVQYCNVSYLGRGEYENYCDRKEGSKIGIYSSNIKDNLTPYVIPQECGNRCDVSWISLTNGDNGGIIFSAPKEKMEASFLPYTCHELENAKHAYELPPITKSVVRVSKYHMGVGGDDSWGAKTHDEYLIKGSTDKTFKFMFKGL